MIGRGDWLRSSEERGADEESGEGEEEGTHRELGVEPTNIRQGLRMR